MILAPLHPVLQTLVDTDSLLSTLYTDALIKYCAGMCKYAYSVCMFMFNYKKYPSSVY